MEVRIGIRENGRDLSFESASSSKELTDQISSAISSGAALVELTDDKGKTILVPTSAIAYVEIGVDQSRRVGFIA
jgi:prefoldin subunit 5